jgi:putative ABC transport system ATP-binding protein
MIEFADVRFAYPHGEFELYVPEWRVAAEEKVAVIGPSGSGKTTLLYLAAGIVRPWSGTVRVDGHEISRQGDAERRSFRIRKIGLVFQEFELLEYLTVRDNILLPYRINPALRLDRAVAQRVATVAEAVGLAETLDRHPSRLSHGERQRVALSRALITQPRLILADEPTGNLDPRTSRTIVSLMLEQAEKTQATVLMVTHDHSLLGRFDRVLDLEQLVRRQPAAGPR